MHIRRRASAPDRRRQVGDQRDHRVAAGAGAQREVAHVVAPGLGGRRRDRGGRRGRGEAQGGLGAGQRGLGVEQRLQKGAASPVAASAGEPARTGGEQAEIARSECQSEVKEDRLLGRRPAWSRMSKR